MPPLFANDIGGIGQAIMQDRAHRDQLTQTAIGRLMQARQEAERKREWEITNQQHVQQAAQALQMNQQQLQMQRDAAIAAALRQKQEFDLKTREFNEYSLPSLQQHQDAGVKQAADKLALERQRALTESLQYHVENDLPFDPAQFKDVPAEIAEPKLKMAEARRRQQAEQVVAAQRAALFANRFKLIEKHAADLKKSDASMPTGSGVNVLGVFGNKINPGFAGSDQAKQLTDRMETFRQQFQALTDPKKGLVEVDPESGNFVPRKELVRPWMVGTNAPATNLNWNRGNAMASAMPQQTATGDTSEAQPMEANGAATMPMTGTNRPGTPPIIRSKADFDQLPSGTIYINAKTGQPFQKP